MKPTPESRSPLDVPQTQSARAAREYSLLAETQKEVREILKEEIHGARQLVEYYDKYYGKIGFLNIAGRELEHKGLPPAGGVFLDHARQHFGAEDTISQLEQASEDELATMWQDLLQELDQITVTAYALRNLQINSWMIKQNNRWQSYEQTLKRHAYNLSSFDSEYLTDALASDYPKDPSMPSQKELIEWFKDAAENEKIFLGEEEPDERIWGDQFKKDGPELISYSAKELSPQERKTYELYFGKEFIKVIQDILPNEFKRTVNSVNFTGSKSSRKVDVFGEKRYGYAAGTYHPGHQEISLCVPDHLSMPRVPGTLLHEAGHAIDFGEERPAALRMKLRFLEAVAVESSLNSLYTTYSYAHDGLQTGLEEDFAETVKHFFTDHEMLKKLCPQRHSAMADIIKFLYPSIDVDQVREKIKETWRAGTERLMTNPEVLRNYITDSEQTMWAALNMYHSQNFRPLDFCQTRGEPNSKRNRHVTDTDINIYETFDENGRLFEEVTANPNHATKTLFNVEYDEQGRIESYSTEALGVTLDAYYTYDQKNDLPKEINYTYAGAVIRTVRYEKRGNEIIEHLDLPLNRDQGLKSRYTLGPDGKISRVEGLVADQPVFVRHFEYDDQGRLLAKKVADHHDSTTIKQSQYSYEDGQEYKQAA